jgi:hypothetical protein
MFMLVNYVRVKEALHPLDCYRRWTGPFQHRELSGARGPVYISSLSVDRRVRSDYPQLDRSQVRLTTYNTQTRAHPLVSLPEQSVDSSKRGKMPKLESKADTNYQLQLPKVSFRVIDDGQASLSHTGVRSVSWPQRVFSNQADCIGAESFVWM